jgi:hypothetical protein
MYPPKRQVEFQTQCEQAESRCTCEKFCVLCQSQINIRLCTDGLMYCEACRTACDYKTVPSEG